MRWLRAMHQGVSREGLRPNEALSVFVVAGDMHCETAEIAGRGLYCHNCFAVCPAGKLDDEELFSLREAKSFYRS